MKYSVTFYCPDKHLVYDGRMPDEKGVGGGVTARIRLATALAAQGHQVSLICNCPRKEIVANVNYIPLDEATQIYSDVLICTTSGDRLDLTPILDLDVQTRLRILWVHGHPLPGGTAGYNPDYFYPPANYMRRVIRDEWNVPPEKIFTSYHGINKSYFQTSASWKFFHPRHPFRIAYAGNPFKGLNAAIGILRILRSKNPLFHLHVFGDERLWGAREAGFQREKGVHFLGTVNQKRLPLELQTCNFALNLQARQEPFGITMVESMYAGCIVAASPVGAYSELITHGESGLLIPGDPDSPETWAMAASKILRLAINPSRVKTMRANAFASVLDWLDVAQTCEQHWDYVLGVPSASTYTGSVACPECKAGNSLYLHDGYHCISCGNYWAAK